MKLRGIRESIGGLFLKCLEHDAFDVFRNSGDDLAWRVRLIIRMLLSNFRWSRTGERRHTRQHLVENHAETVNVRSRSQLIAVVLFRRHVTRRADHWVRVVERGYNFVIIVRRERRDTEVEHFDNRGLIGALRDENIRRLQIAMNDAGFVSRCNCGGSLQHQRDRSRCFEWGFATERLAQRATFEQFHHDVNTAFSSVTKVSH